MTRGGPALKYLGACGIGETGIVDGDRVELSNLQRQILHGREDAGVHLGQEDLPLPAARKLAPELLIGISAHSREEALKVQSEGADYVNIGPIFPTRTKEGVKRFLGPAAIAGVAAGLEVPFTVMGGISGANIGQVLAEGARRVAVVTAVTTAVDMAGTVAFLREKIRQAGAMGG